MGLNRYEHINNDKQLLILQAGKAKLRDLVLYNIFEEILKDIFGGKKTFFSIPFSTT